MSFPSSFLFTHYLAAPGGKPTPEQVVDWFARALQAKHASVVRAGPDLLDFTVSPGVWFESGELAWVRAGSIEATEGGSELIAIEAEVHVTRLPMLVGVAAPVLGALFPFAMLGTVVGGLLLGGYMVAGPYRASRTKISTYLEETCGEISASFAR